MARRRKDEQLVIEGIAPEEQPAAESGRAGKPRLVLPLTEDGRIDWEVMRAATREKLQRALEGMPGPAAGVEEQAQVAQALLPVVPALYRVLGSLEGLLAAWIAKVPRDQALQVMAYSDDEIQGLSGPTAAVLAKHAGALAEYQAEAALILHLAAIHQVKIAHLVELKREQEAERVKPVPAPVAAVQ